MKRAPKSELFISTCKIQVRTTLQGRLFPLSRFLLVDGQTIHLTEGLDFGSYIDGYVEPTASVNVSGKKAKAIWIDPEKRPWRELTSLLGQSSEFKNLQMSVFRQHMQTLSKVNQDKSISIWSGGIRTSSNSGEYYVTGSDDYVESIFDLTFRCFSETWYLLFKEELQNLETRANQLYGCVRAYQKELKQDGDQLSKLASCRFWERCEQYGQNLIDVCAEISERTNDELAEKDSDSDESALEQLRKKFYLIELSVFDQMCPNITGRQMQAWVKCRPSVHVKKK